MPRRPRPEPEYFDVWSAGGPHPVVTITDAPAALPALGHLAGDYTPGLDPQLTWEEYRHTIETAIGGQARSQQTRIGPSELGMDCLHCLACKLAGIPEKRDAAWLPWVGTAVHAQLEDVFHAFNAAAGTVRFLIETTVSVGEVAGVDITGHADL